MHTPAYTGSFVKRTFQSYKPALTVTILAECVIAAQPLYELCYRLFTRPVHTLPIALPGLLIGLSLPTMEPSGRKLVVTSFEEF